jgi:hypothetical protein
VAGHGEGSLCSGSTDIGTAEFRRNHPYHDLCSSAFDHTSISTTMHFLVEIAVLLAVAVIFMANFRA